MATSFAKVQAERISHLYHRLRNAWPIWFYVLNARPRRLWRQERVQLDAVQQTIAETLARDGIAIIPLKDIMKSDAFFAGMRAYVEKRLADPAVIAEGARRKTLLAERSQEGKKSGGKYLKDFWVSLFPADEQGKVLYEKDNPFLKFLMTRRVLDVAATYFGFLPKLNSFMLQQTLLVPPGAPAYLSQRWHRDPEDKKMLKVFIYMTDVNNIGAGPFTYVKGSQLGGRWRHVFPQRPPAGSYPPEGEVEKIVPKSDIQVCLAPAGTVIFCDTSGLHRGGYSTTTQRVLLLPAFSSRASKNPINFHRPDQSVIAGMNPVAQYALLP